MSSSAVSSSEPVRIGAFLLYCESFKVEGTRLFTEKFNVSGEGFYSNTGEKSLKLTLAGRVCDSDLPLRFALYTQSVMHSNSVLTVSYKGIEYSSCYVQSFSQTDSCKGYTEASVTLITRELPSEKAVSG